MTFGASVGTGGGYRTVSASRMGEGGTFARVCDGVADQDEINAAIRSLPDAGGLVQLSAGTFWLSAPVLATPKHLAIRGAGRGVTTLRLSPGADCWAIEFARAGDLDVWAQIADLTIDGDAPNQAAGGCVYAHRAIQARIENVECYRGHKAGVYIHEGTGGPVGHHVEVARCLIHGGNQSAGDGYGVLIEASDECFIHHNDLENNGGATGDKSHIKDLSGLQIIAHNTLVNGEEGIRVQDAHRSVIAHNILDHVKRHGIVVSGGRCAIHGNQIYGPGRAEPDGANGNWRGIWLASGPGMNNVQGNVIEAHETSGYTYRLIQEDGTGGNGANLIVNNHLLGHGRCAAGSNKDIFSGGAGSTVAPNVSVA